MLAVTLLLPAYFGSELVKTSVQELGGAMMLMTSAVLKKGWESRLI